jgi:uncharacterized protein YcgI (DUF1989 family)
VDNVRVVKREVAPRNSGWSSDIRAGQILRLEARTIIDFVAFDLKDFTEGFDQARTKEASGCIYMRRGDAVLSRSGLRLMTMLADGFEGMGTHDMQFGMCSRARHERAASEGRLGEYLHADLAVPTHGCAENLTSACAPWGIPYVNIPSPINFFQNMAIEQATGRMQRTQVRPDTPVALDLRAERDLLVAFSACPDKASRTGGLEVVASIIDP